MKQLTQHEIKDAEGKSVYSGDDAEEAAKAADEATRAGQRVTIETTYDDGEPAATSVHTGAREQEVAHERAAVKEAEKPAKAESRSKS